MIKALITDFSRVLLSPVDKTYTGGLNPLHRELSARESYNFWEFFELNQELLEFYKTLSEKMDVYLFTSEYIQEHPAIYPTLEKTFKNIFSAARHELKKSEPETYKIVADMVRVSPEEILYIDDKQSNLDPAKIAGMSTILFESNEQVMEEIKNLVS